MRVDQWDMIEAQPFAGETPTQPLDSVQRIADLEKALADAIVLVADWAAYAGEYFQKKHDLAGDLAELQAVLDGGQYIEQVPMTQSEVTQLVSEVLARRRT